MNKKVLSIAGSDPSGGAGIQADIKTFTSLGVYGGAVITCLTVQNTLSVSDVFFLKGEFVKREISAVLKDIDISFIKIGMLGNSDIAQAVGETLEGYFIVCDPVMISKSGYPLMEESSMKAVERFVICKSSILTPNYHELMKLTKNKLKNPIEAGKTLLKKYENLQAILVKGGHIDESGEIITDTLIFKEKGRIEKAEYSHRRFFTKNTHGTGCTLSSAITAFLARNNNMVKSVEMAINYVNSLIEMAAKNTIGKGNGALLHHLNLGVF